MSNGAHGRIAYRFQARDLHLVLGPAADGKPVRFRVLVDGKAPLADHGADTDEQGYGTIEAQKLYQLVRQQKNGNDRLFEIAPSVKPLFPADMAEQRRKLMATLAIVVNGLSNLESVLPAASALATRHVSYGAKAEHYPVVGSALLWTLKNGLGADWTPEISDAWTAAYKTLSEFMINQAYGRPQAAE